MRFTLYERSLLCSSIRIKALLKNILSDLFYDNCIFYTMTFFKLRRHRSWLWFRLMLCGKDWLAAEILTFLLCRIKRIFKLVYRSFEIIFHKTVCTIYMNRTNSRFSYARFYSNESKDSPFLWSHTMFNNLIKYANYNIKEMYDFRNVLEEKVC